MANDTELALSAVLAGEGIRFTPTLQSVQRISPWTEPPRASHKGKPAGLGVAGGAHNTPAEPGFGATYYLFIIYFYLFPPRKSLIVFYHSHMPLGKRECIDFSVPFY